MGKLNNPKHERFCLEYLKDMNATRAYVRAGYKDSKAAESSACMLLKNPKVAARVRELQKEADEALKLEAHRVIRNLSLMSDFDILDYYNDDGSLKVLSELTPEQRVAIVGIERDSIKMGDDYYHEVMTYRLADKVKVSDMMMRHHGQYSDKLKVEGEIDLAAMAKRRHEKKRNADD